MLFFVDDKHLIKILREEKQYTACKFVKEFPNKKWSRGGLNHLLEKKSTNLVVLNALLDHGQRIMLKTSSQEDCPQSHRSVRLEAHISRSSIHNIITKD